MQQINLLDLSVLPRRQLLSAPLLVGVIGAMALALGLHSAYEVQSLKAAGLLHLLPGSTPQAAASAPDTSQPLLTRIATLEALQAQTQAQSSLPTQVGPTLNAIAAALPDSVWLSAVELGNAGALRIAGGTLEPKALQDLAQRLSQLPGLHGQPVTLLRIEPLGLASASGDNPAAASATHRFVIAAGGDGTAEDTP